MTSKKSCKKLKILKGLYSTSPKSTDHAWIIVADLLTGKSNKYMNVKKARKMHTLKMFERLLVLFKYSWTNFIPQQKLQRLLMRWKLK